MTVTSTNQKIQFNGNGSTTVFAYNFKIFAQTDLSVILRSATGTETVQQLTTNYTVSGVGAASGGNVTMGTAPPSGTTLTILRVQPNLQGLDLVPNDPFPAGSMEDALDKLTFMVQTHDEEIGRSIKASRTNVIGDSEFTVSATDRANKLFSFDGSGNLSITQELGTYRGNWAASTAYAVRDLVKDTSTNNIFIVITAHTSSGSQPITTNTDAAKWALIVDAASATTSQTAAAASATLASQWAIKTDDTVDGTNYSAKYWATRSDVAAVAGKATEIGRLGTSDAVADLAILGTDAIVSNLGTVAGIAANVTSVAGVASNVTTVAGISSAVSTVAADGSDIGTVAGISSAVSTVSSANANVSTVAGAVSNVNTVAGAVSNVNTVAGAVSNVNTVAGISSAVSTVAADATDIGNVSGSIANVNTVAANLSGITAFSAVYSSGGTDPSSNLNAGDLFFNTGSDVLKVYDGSNWVSGVTAGSGFLPLSGGTMTGNLVSGDNVKATFGAGSDLEIFHDGTNSLIDDTDTGFIAIRSDTSVKLLKRTGNENMVVAVPDGAVTLYHNNAAKLATTSTGVDVTGNVVVSGTVDGVDLQTLNSAVSTNTSKTTNATHTGEVTGSGALTIADNVVDEANLKVSNSAVNGYFLSAQSGNTGGLTWAEASGGGKENVVWFDVANPDNTYTSSGTWSKGSLADDAYVWFYLVGGGGGGGKDTGNPAGYGFGGEGGGAVCVYGTAGVLDGAAYVIGAGSAPADAYQQRAGTDSTLTLSSAQGSEVFTTSKVSSGTGLFVLAPNAVRTLLNATVAVEANLTPDVVITLPSIPTSWGGTYNSASANSWTGGAFMQTSKPGGNGIFGGGGGGGEQAGTLYATPGGSLYAGAGGAGGSSPADGTVPGGGGGGNSGNSNGGSGAAGNVRVYHV